MQYSLLQITLFSSFSRYMYFKRNPYKTLLIIVILWNKFGLFFLIMLIKRTLCTYPLVDSTVIKLWNMTVLDRYTNVIKKFNDS